MIIVTNDVNFTGDWATTGPWPYDMPGRLHAADLGLDPVLREPGWRDSLTACCTSSASSTSTRTRASTFPRPYVDEWDNMAGLYNNVHPLVWSKERAGWLTAHGDTITVTSRGPRPGAQLHRPEPDPAVRQHVDRREPQGDRHRPDRRARRRSRPRTRSTSSRRATTRPASFDSALPGDRRARLLRERAVPQGEGPVILRDKNLLTLRPRPTRSSPSAT